MNRRNVLRSLLTLPVAATTIERTPVQAVQAETPKYGGEVWGSADTNFSNLKIGWTDLTRGKGPQLRDVHDGYIPDIKKLLP